LITKAWLFSRPFPTIAKKKTLVNPDIFAIANQTVYALALSFCKKPKYTYFTM